MQKILIYLAVIIILTVGCNNNPLEITPDGRITVEDVFQNDRRTEAYLNTIYGYIPSYFYSYSYSTFLAVVTDEAHDGDGQGGAMAANWTAGAATTSFNPIDQSVQPGSNADHYVSFWKGIRAANVFLENIDNAPIANVEFKSRMMAEAQLLRSFFYWELIKEYGPMPIIKMSFPNGFDYKSLIRPTFQETVDFIISECDAVIANPNLPMRLTQEADRGRFTKAVAYAIKSEALLYNASPLWNSSNDGGKWKAAANASREALNELTTGGEYALAPDYDYYFVNRTDINSSPRDRETIYERTQNETSNLLVENGLPAIPGVQKTGVSPSQELVDSYDMKATGEPAITGYQDADHLKPIINSASGYMENDPYSGRDPRFYATIFYNGSQYDNIAGVIHTVETFVGGQDQLLRGSGLRSNTKSGYYLRKFMDPKIQLWQQTGVRWKKYRLGEIYLNFAEAENEADGPTVDVYSAINTIRRRVQMPDIPPGLNKEQMRERIRRERRVELAIEEHRFWDVRRWKILDQTDKLVTGMEITKNPNNTFSYNRFIVERRSAGWQDKYRILPIPLQDISAIPDFREHQNPGW